jgi:hypothetical protein
VLSETPVLLGAADMRFTTKEPLEVKGMTGELCLLLSRDVNVKDDIDAQYRKLLGDTQLKAVLHARDGKNYLWTRGGWQVPHGPVESRGALSACFWLRCNEEHPPKGTDIVSFDLSSSRPLRILGTSWYSSDSMDSAYGVGTNSSASPRCANAYPHNKRDATN